MRRRYLLAVLCSVLMASSVLAQESSKYAGEFLRIPVGGRSLGMGGAYTAIADDESAFHWNPAGVSLLKNKNLGMMYSSEFGGIGSALASFWHLGYSMPVSELSVGINWVRLSVGDLEATPDLTGINITAKRQELVRALQAGPKDLFSDIEDAVVISLARNNTFDMDWGWLYYSQPIEVPVGINVKLINQKIGRFAHANGIGIDAGAMLRFSVGEFLLMPFLGKLSLGLNVTDLFGTRIAWSTERSHEIPMRINAGTAYTQQLPFINSAATIALDFTTLEREKARIGLDVLYKDQVSIRAGLNQGLFAAGAGFNWEKRVTVNYSLGLHEALGPQHRLSFGVNIDETLAYLRKEKGTAPDAGQETRQGDESTRTGQENSRREQEGSGREQEGSGREQEGSGREQEDEREKDAK